MAGPHRAPALNLRARWRDVIVLNVAGNKYRLVIAAHFNRGIVYTLRSMTHAEYSKQKWKDDL